VEELGYIVGRNDVFLDVVGRYQGERRMVNTQHVFITTKLGTKKSSLLKNKNVLKYNLQKVKS
jgi:hypothetical protein